MTVAIGEFRIKPIGGATWFKVSDGTFPGPLPEGLIARMPRPTGTTGVNEPSGVFNFGQAQVKFPPINGSNMARIYFVYPSAFSSDAYVPVEVEMIDEWSGLWCVFTANALRPTIESARNLANGLHFFGVGIEFIRMERTE